MCYVGRHWQRTLRDEPWVHWLGNLPVTAQSSVTAWRARHARAAADNRTANLPTDVSGGSIR